VTTFVLIHGGGSTGWDWHLGAPLLERAGHDVVAVDLPIEDANAVLADYVAAVSCAVGSVPVEIPGGHYAALSEPGAVAGALNDFARELAAAGPGR
jgi:pimeloyl-ACP methyl ester carboxylesterase